HEVRSTIVPLPSESNRPLRRPATTCYEEAPVSMRSPTLLAFASTLTLALVAASGFAAPAKGDAAVAESPSAFPFPITEKTLPNGLHVYVVQYDSPGLVAYYTIVRTGSRNEIEPGKSGFAHFFEHMMFRGTEKYPKDKFTAALKSIGADNNAYTSDDETVYHTVASADALETMMDIESD